MMPAAYTYILMCADGTFYTGWTTDLARRVKAHNEGRGAKYTRGRGPVRLCYYEEFGDKHEAQSREWHIKRLSHGEKQALIDKAGKETYNCTGSFV